MTFIEMGKGMHLPQEVQVFEQHFSHPATLEGLGSLLVSSWCATGRVVGVTCLTGDTSHLSDGVHHTEAVLQ